MKTDITQPCPTWLAFLDETIEEPSVELSAEFGLPVRVVPAERVYVLTPEESAELDGISGPDD